MERIDIYDKAGNRTGRVVERGSGYELSKDEYKLAVGMWIVDGENRIFLTRRSMEKSYAPGKWENPAGHVQAGEIPVDAVIRELLEETGIRVEKEQIVMLGASRFWPYLGRDYGVRMHVDVKDVKFQKGETDGAKWVTFEEFVSMAKAGDFPPSLTDHMKDYKADFLKFVGQEGSTAL